MSRHPSVATGLATLALLGGTLAQVSTSTAASMNRTEPTTGIAATSKSPGTAPPTTAGACWNGTLCEYAGTFWTGEVRMSDTVKPGQCVGLDYYWAGVRSARNRTGQYARLWSNSDCTGRNYLLKPGAAAPTFGFLAKASAAAGPGCVLVRRPHAAPASLLRPTCTGSAQPPARAGSPAVVEPRRRSGD